MVQEIYNLVFREGSNSMSMTDVTGATDMPLTTQELTYVGDGDIDGDNYVDGSQGQIKSIKYYNTGASSGAAARLKTLFYGDASLPASVTKIVISASTV